MFMAAILNMCHVPCSMQQTLQINKKFYVLFYRFYQLIALYLAQSLASSSFNEVLILRKCLNLCPQTFATCMENARQKTFANGGQGGIAFSSEHLDPNLHHSMEYDVRLLYVAICGMYYA